jgi:surface protein
MMTLIKNISLLFFFLIFLVFSNSSKSNAYDCYDASNAGTVAPDNGSVCANMYIVPSTSGAGATKLKNATHSGSNAYISHGGERYYLGEVAGEKKVFTGQVVNFNRVFYNKRQFNGDIGYWDMSSAVVTSEMFKNARKFNQDISGWDMSKNKWYWGMFYNAKKFNQDISGWDTSRAVSFSTMFLGANIFNQDIGNWDTSRVFTMFQMFRNTKKFNQDLGSWNTSSVTAFTGMFQNASAFNNGGSDSINNWNTSKANKMKNMFLRAVNFNQPLHSWTIKSGTGRGLLHNFLNGAIKYNKDLSCLDTSVWTSTKAPKNWKLKTKLVSAQYPNWGRSVPSSCTTAPTLSSSTPADDATNVSSTANIVLTFSENVDVESGNITIKKTSDDSAFETIDVTSNKVTGTGTTTIEINPANTFASSTEYYILIDATAFDDTLGNSYAGISSTTALSFTSQDTGNPYLTSTVPAHQATAIAVDANIVLNFSESVDAESGNIVIKKHSDDSIVETIDVTGGQVSGSGTNQITINPSADFDELTKYYIEIATTAFDDAGGNSFVGIDNSSIKLRFTTEDATNPTLSTSSPTDGATDVNTLSSLVLTFDEAIDAETGGEVYLYKSDDTLVKTYSVTDADYVNRSSSFTYTVDISAELEASTSYYIKINSSAFDDTAGNSYAGISDATTLNFSTAATNCGCVSGQLVNKNDVVQSGATVQLLDSSNNLIDTTTTDDEGRYDLYPSTSGTYKVLYVKSTNKKWRAKNAHGKFNGRYVEDIDFTTDCEEYMDMDAVLVDPAGVVYDSSTRAAISGATVRLFFNGALVNNDWLDSATGTNTEITDAQGQYSFVLNGNAASGDYVLEVEPPSGYIFESSTIPAETAAYVPALGSGTEEIQDQDGAPTTSDDTTYYLTFTFTIASLASETSNGVVNNHIPVDSISNSSQELVNKAKAPLTKVLKQDFHDTVSGQMNLFNDIARQSLNRLGDQIDQCGDIHSDISLDKIQLLQALEQEMLDGDYSSKMKDCNSNRSFYTDVQFKVTTSRYVGTQYRIQLNQTQEFKIHDEHLRGIFYGGYLSNSDVTASADGTIEGRGVHLGVYETIQYRELNYNFYVAASHGKHDFDFDILDGFTPDRIKTKGDYGYYAGYTGASVSGELKMQDTTLIPRLSIDSAYAESDEVNVDFTAKQKNIEQSGNLMLDQLNGSRVTTELVFHHPTQLRDWELIAEITPRFFCQQSVGEIEETCGIGNKLLFQGFNNRYGNFDMGIDFENVDGIRRESYMFSHIITIFENLSISSSYSFDESMQASVNTGFEYSLDY